MAAKAERRSSGEEHPAEAGPVDESVRDLFACCVSLPFDAEFDAVYNLGLQPLSESLSNEDYRLDLVRLDEEAYGRRSVYDVVKRINTADILVADVTPPQRPGRSPDPNVMYEIGYATGNQIPLLLIGQKGTHENLPSDLRELSFVSYDRKKDPRFRAFAEDVRVQLNGIIEKQVRDRIRGEFRVECFSERARVNLPRLIRKAKRRIYILTTNLEYTASNLTPAISEALENNKDNSAFKVEILTMDPEADVANARAIQLGRDVRKYRNELRDRLDDMKTAFGAKSRVEIVTYRTLPTQMTFIIDDVVITAIVSLGQQSREGVHFVLNHIPVVAEAFVVHFRVLKTLAVANP